MAVTKTTFVTITGPARWARLYESNKDTKYGDASNVEIQLDSKALETLKNVGWRGKIKEDNWAKFSRKHEQIYADGPRKMGCPMVLSSSRKPFSEMIGNGSILSLKLEVYPSKFGIGSRIEEVTVLEHVPYVKGDIEDGAPPVD